MGGADGTPAFTLYFFDTGDNSKVPSVDGYDWVWGDQIGWYMAQSKAFAEVNGRTLPAFAVFHIPLPEYEEMLHHVHISGHHFDKVSPAAVNSGLLAAFVSRQEVKAATVVSLPPLSWSCSSSLISNATCFHVSSKKKNGFSHPMAPPSYSHLAIRGTIIATIIVARTRASTCATAAGAATLRTVVRGSRPLRTGARGSFESPSLATRFGHGKLWTTVTSPRLMTR